MTLHSVDHGPASEPPKQDERSHGQRIADLIERLWESLKICENPVMPKDVRERIVGDSKRELAEAIDDLAAEIPSDIGDLI
jgi:hypothetical protein